MSKTRRKCEICGREYIVCNTALNARDRFAYEKAACSPECGAEFFRRAMVARGELPQETKAEPVVVEAVETEDVAPVEEPAYDAVLPEDEPPADEADKGDVHKNTSKRKK